MYEVVYLSSSDAMAVLLLNSDPILHCIYSHVLVPSLILKSFLRVRDLGLLVHNLREVG